MNDLLYLIQNEHIEQAKQWLEEHPSFFHQNPQASFTLLDEALHLGSLPALNMLIGHGADVNGVGRGGSSLLWFAVQYTYANTDHASLLIDHGINIHHRDHLGNTALFYAVGSREQAFIELLARRGADLDTRGQFGFTALMWAVKLGSFDITEQLIKLGASLLLKTPQDESLLELAQHQGQERIAQYLSPLFLAAQEKDTLDIVTKTRENLQDPPRNVSGLTQEAAEHLVSGNTKPQNLRL